jgi:branched-chain amino acid transport system permease protein
VVSRSSTIEGPIIGALILFGLQQWLSREGTWDLVLVGGIAVVATLTVPRGLWGFVSSRWGWSLYPVGYRERD